MRSKLARRLGMVLATAWALVGLSGAAANAGNLDLDELAAALALPVITGSQPPNPIKATQGDLIHGANTAITLNTITNARSTPVLLRVDVVSGDPATPFVGGDTWQSDSFDCLLTGRETSTFLHIPLAGGSSIVYVECSTPLATDGVLAENRIIGAKAANGILWVAAADAATGNSVSEDVLFGDSVVIDLAGQVAYGFGAIPFQAGAGFNDGNKVYRFNDAEYLQWPGVLAANFIAPDTAPVPTRIVAELILFTLDGTTGNPTPPRVAVTGLGYDDDENFFDFQHEFDCFDVVSLGDISANFSQVFNGGSLSGHLQLVAQPVATANDSHDAAYGNDDNVRRRPVHGWIVQTIAAGAAIALPGQPATTQLGAIAAGPSPAAWGRPLTQGRGALHPMVADQAPVFDADPLF